MRRVIFSVGYVFNLQLGGSATDAVLRGDTLRLTAETSPPRIDDPRERHDRADPASNETDRRRGGSSTMDPRPPIRRVFILRGPTRTLR